MGRWKGEEHISWSHYWGRKKLQSLILGSGGWGKGSRIKYEGIPRQSKCLKKPSFCNTNRAWVPRGGSEENARTIWVVAGLYQQL